MGRCAQRQASLGVRVFCSDVSRGARPRKAQRAEREMLFALKRKSERWRFGEQAQFDRRAVRLIEPCARAKRCCHKDDSHTNGRVGAPCSVAEKPCRMHECRGCEPRDVTMNSLDESKHIDVHAPGASTLSRWLLACERDKLGLTRRERGF